MKTFLIVSYILAAAADTRTDYLNKISELWRDPITECANQNGFTNMTVQEIYDKEQIDGGANSTCLEDCVMTLIGVIQNGTIYQQTLSDYIDGMYTDQTDLAATLKEAKNRCLPPGGDIQADECKMAYDFVQCFLNNI